jgi:hypothetical protein
MVFGVIFTVTTLILIHPIFYFDRLAPHMATPILFSGLYLSPNSGYIAWDELAARPLDPRWTEVMAKRVLEIRKGNNWANSVPSEWFENMMTSNQVSKELAERYYRESFAANLNVPSKVKPGAAFTVTLRVTHAAGSGHSYAIGLMFAGYSIDDADPSTGRELATFWRHEFSPRALSRSKDVLSASLVAPDKPEFQVRAVFWLVHKPSYMEELQWQDDGTPARPATAFWFERREVVKTVRVER